MINTFLPEHSFIVLSVWWGGWVVDGPQYKDLGFGFFGLLWT